MTLPLDVPTAKPPADLAPAGPPALAPPPPPPAPIPAPADPIVEVVEPAIVQALRAVEPYAYFERMARLEPQLFFKWASLLMGQKRASTSTQNVINVVTAIPRSPLDQLPPGFEING